MLSASFRRSTHKQPHGTQQTLLIWMGVGLWVLAACAGRSTKSQGFQQTTWPSRPLSGLLEVRGRAGTAPNPWNLPALGVPPQTPQKNTDHPNGRGFGVLLYCLTAGKVIRGAASLRSPYTGRLYPPSPCCRDARPGASVGASSAALACVCREITHHGGVRFVAGIGVCLL